MLVLPILGTVGLGTRPVLNIYTIPDVFSKRDHPKSENMFSRLKSAARMDTLDSARSKNATLSYFLSTAITSHQMSVLRQHPVDTRNGQCLKSIVKVMVECHGFAWRLLLRETAANQ